MKAFILAAGEGTRLKPLTDNIPKALLPIGGFTLLEIAIRRIAGAGIREIIINVHHYSDQIIEFLRLNDNFGLDICLSDESDKLLDTGGAIKKASGFFQNEETVLVYNVDILSNLNIRNLMSFHLQNNALITLAVKDRPTSRSLIIDSSGRLCGWEYPDKKLSILTRENRKGLKYTAFSGVYAFSTRLLDKLPEDEVFGLIPWMLDLAADETILTWDQSPSFWYEAGRPDSFAHAARSLSFDLDDPDFIRENPR